MTLMNVSFEARFPTDDLPQGSAQETAPEKKPVQPPPLLYEMLRSFVTLSRTLNLSHAVADLASTRQTLRRHIAILEELKGGALFEIRDRRYELTPLGKSVLPEASDLVAMATAWARGQMSHVHGMQYLAHVKSETEFFYQQQHPLGRAFNSTGNMLQKVIGAWSTAQGQIDHEALRAVRPYCNIFRRVQGALIFAEVGEDSSFVSWFGSVMARSTVGRALEQMPGGDDLGRLVDAAYTEIEHSQAIRLDHIHTAIPRESASETVPITYERLMLGARFPDESPAIISVVRRTYDVEIKGVGETMLRRMPKDAVMS